MKKKKFKHKKIGDKKFNYKKVFKNLIFELNNNNIQLYDIYYLSSYFIFDRGLNSIMHFKIKGLKHWTFGAWVIIPDKENKLKKHTIKIFCQPSLFIDKFKPSRGYFCEEIETCTFDSLSSENNYHFYDISYLLNIINFMQKKQSLLFYFESMETSIWFIKNRPLVWYKFKMMSAILKENLNLWYHPKAFFITKTALKIGSKLNSTETYLYPDIFAEDRNSFRRYNDDFYIYTKNIFGLLIGRLAKKILKSSTENGHATVFQKNEKINWMCEYNSIIFDKEFTSEELYDFQETEGKKRFEKLIKI